MHAKLIRKCTILDMKIFYSLILWFDVSTNIYFWHWNFKNQTLHPHSFLDFEEVIFQTKVIIHLLIGIYNWYIIENQEDLLNMQGLIWILLL